MKLPERTGSPTLPTNKILTITKILNGLLKISYFPTPCKIAKTVSIPKPGKDHLIPSNYRLIALLSSMSRIYKRIFLNYLRENLKGKLRNEQFAF